MWHGVTATGFGKLGLRLVDRLDQLVAATGPGLDLHGEVLGFRLMGLHLLGETGILRGRGFDPLDEGFDLRFAADGKFTQLAEAGFHRLLLGFSRVLCLTLHGQGGPQFVQGLGKLGLIAL